MNLSAISWPTVAAAVIIAIIVHMFLKKLL
jgi:hypothetical protein